MLTDNIKCDHLVKWHGSTNQQGDIATTVLQCLAPWMFMKTKAKKVFPSLQLRGIGFDRCHQVKTLDLPL